MVEVIFFSCFLDKLTIHRNLFVPLAVSCNTTTAVARGAALAADGCWRLGHRNRYRCWCAWREGDSCGDRSRRWRRRRSSRNWIRLFCGIVCPLFLKRCRDLVQQQNLDKKLDKLRLLKKKLGCFVPTDFIYCTKTSNLPETVSKFARAWFGIIVRHKTQNNHITWNAFISFKQMISINKIVLKFWTLLSGTFEQLPKFLNCWEFISIKTYVL